MLVLPPFPFEFKVRKYAPIKIASVIATGWLEAIVYRLPVDQDTGAELMANSSGQPFHTDQQGYLQGRGRLELGDKLVAFGTLWRRQRSILTITRVQPSQKVD